jgi:methionine sulfoxide reductase heme-binding subunit
MTAGHHLFWITSRAAGTAALVTASASVAFGLLMAARRRGVNTTPEYRPVHEALSLITLALIGLHGIALLGDQFMRPGFAGITVPFVGPYRPLWTGIGIISGYGLALLGLTYYMRARIGTARWRMLHRFTSLFWLLGIVHTIGSGSDSGQLWFLMLVGAPVLVAAGLLAGRLARGLGAALDLPRGEAPVRQMQ